MQNFVSIGKFLCFFLENSLRKYLYICQSIINRDTLLFQLIQAYANYANGSTGQLSGVTVVMLWAGSLARIFTSIQETGDTMTVLTYVAAFSCNCVLFAQILYYSKKAKSE